jgi:sugar/nucleoside kinase (ribokinase family)
MNFWIDGSRAELEKVLGVTDILLINEAEAKQLAGETNAVRAAGAITAMGPKIVVVKRGEYGALLVAPGLRVPVPAMPMDEVTDPTGAGDTFAGGFLGYLASRGDLGEATLRKAMCVGTVMASFTIERFGTERIAAATAADIEERLALFCGAAGMQGL